MKRNRIFIRKGFTLIEIMVVLVILSLMAMMLVPKIMSRPDQARVTKAKADMATLSSALKLYKLDNGFYPTTEQGLVALVQQPTTEPIPMSWKPDGYIEGKEAPKDPWERQYIYRSPGDNGAAFQIISYGADGKEGGTGFDEDIILSN